MTTQEGQVRVVKDGVLLTTPFVTVVTDTYQERGLNGIAVDPDFATNQYIYIYYTATTPTVHNRVSRFTANGDVATSGSETVILDLDDLRTDGSLSGSHNSGDMHFGLDGKLYISVGDNALGDNAQTIAGLRQKGTLMIFVTSARFTHIRMSMGLQEAARLQAGLSIIPQRPDFLLNI